MASVRGTSVNESLKGIYSLEEMPDYVAQKYGSLEFDNAPELRLYAHNSTYDGSFMLRHLMNLQILEKDNKYVSMKGAYCYWKGGAKKYINVLVKDSNRLIPMRLADIPESLGFKDKAVKEVMYYNMFNYKTMDHITRMSKNELNTYIQEFNNNSHNTKKQLDDKRNDFMNNLSKWKCVNNDGTYDMLKYSQLYCEIDCDVLKLGMEKWKSLWEEIDSRNDVNKFYSLPSLAQYYFKINDCSDGCPELCGSLGAFFQNFVSGGRVMTHDNVKQFVEESIQDFDAVSLYPSAMHLFDGFLRGIPKRIATTDYNALKHKDRLFLKVRITKVGKVRPFPVLNYMDKATKTKNWSNDLVDKICFLDKTGLEDAITFQGWSLMSLMVTMLTRVITQKSKHKLM